MTNTSQTELYKKIYISKSNRKCSTNKTWNQKPGNSYDCATMKQHSPHHKILTTNIRPRTQVFVNKTAKKRCYINYRITMFKPSKKTRKITNKV